MLFLSEFIDKIRAATSREFNLMIDLMTLKASPGHPSIKFFIMKVLYFQLFAPCDYMEDEDQPKRYKNDHNSDMLDAFQ